MKRILSILLLIVASHLNAQDIHFSLFNEMPLNLNPALAGNSDATKRAGLIYRNQWNSVTVPFQSTGVYADYRLTHEKLKSNVVGIGLQVLNDKAGSGSLIQNHFNLHVNAQRFIDKKQKKQLSAGIMLGFFQKSFDESKLTFATDFAYESGDFVSNGAGQNLSNSSIIKADFGLGLNYSYFHKNGKASNIGFSFTHLNTPDQSFFGKSDPLQIKSCLHAKTLLKVKNELYAFPTVLVYYQNKAADIVAGSEFNYPLGRRLIEDTELKLGVYYRVRDAVIFTFGINHDNWGINFSYDMNRSGLGEAAKNVNALEIGITIKNKLFNTKTNPKFILPGNRLL